MKLSNDGNIHVDAYMESKRDKIRDRILLLNKHLDETVQNFNILH